jgi:hypothetical protein
MDKVGALNFFFVSYPAFRFINSHFDILQYVFYNLKYISFFKYRLNIKFVFLRLWTNWLRYKFTFS